MGRSLRRDLALGTGVLLLGVALSEPLASWAHHDLRGHMVQHLLLGMIAPVFLVLGAPLTRLLPVLPPAWARLLLRCLHSRVGRLWTHPGSAVLLNVGGMYLLYLTPLYAQTLHSPALHGFVHFHFLAAGYLFAWAVLAGPDAAPRPPSFAIRLGALLLATAAHGILAKLMYGHGWPRGTHHELAEIQDAAQLMYYGGDLAELWLAALLFARWYAGQGRGKGRRAVLRTTEIQPAPAIAARILRRGGCGILPASDSAGEKGAAADRAGLPQGVSPGVRHPGAPAG